LKNSIENIGENSKIFKGNTLQRGREISPASPFNFMRSQWRLVMPPLLSSSQPAHRLNPLIKYAIIPGFDRYMIGADGSLWSNIIPGHKPEKGFVHWHQINPSPDDRGYLIVSLSKVGEERRSMAFHVLVLNTFIGPCPEGLQCRHLDGDESNCALWNLVWGTPGENGNDKVVHGMSASGERNGSAKLTEEQVKEIRRLHAVGTSPKMLASMFNVGKSSVWRIIKGTHWKGVA
jgi:hypothetical protein